MNNLEDIKDLTVLVVDDNSQNIQLVSSILKKAGYTKVAFATSGLKALELVESINPDLILLDIMMPIMDGYEVINMLKTKDSTKNIPVIFLSAKANDDDVAKGLNLGAVDYIPKPFDNEILLARVKTHLTLRYQSKLIENEKLILEERVNEELFKRVQSNAKLYALYNQTKQGMSFIRKDGTFIDVNSSFSEMIGYTKEEVINNLNVAELTYKDDIDKTNIAFRDLCENDLEWIELEKRCVKKDGSIVWFSITLTKVEDPLEENNYYIASTCKDITEQIKLREELKTKEEMLINQARQAAIGNMIGMVAHQWRQPLSIVSMTANNILLDIELESQIDSDALKKDMDEVNEQVQYLSQTIEDFKNYFKPNKVKIFTLIDSVMDKTLKLIGHSFENNNITIEKSYNTQTKIDLFPNELMQVFINILNNAKDELISKKIQNSKIVINIDEDDNNITISIADNAGGIPNSIMNKIGELYFSTKGESGTGLGMYMSKNIIEKHLDGIFRWENSDEGAVFYIMIPKKVENEILPD